MEGNSDDDEPLLLLTLTPSVKLVSAPSSSIPPCSILERPDVVEPLLIALPAELFLRVAALFLPSDLPSLARLRASCKTLRDQLGPVWAQTQVQQAHWQARSPCATPRPSFIRALSARLNRLLTGGPLVLLLDANDLLSGVDFGYDPQYDNSLDGSG